MTHYKTNVRFRIGKTEYLLYFSYEYPGETGKFLNIILKPNFE